MCEHESDADECDDASDGCAARFTKRTPSWRQEWRGQTKADFEIQHASQDGAGAGSPSARSDINLIQVAGQTSTLPN